MTVRGHVFVLGNQFCLFAGIIHVVFIITLFLLFVFIYCIYLFYFLCWFVCFILQPWYLQTVLAIYSKSSQWFYCQLVTDCPFGAPEYSRYSVGNLMLDLSFLCSVLYIIVYHFDLLWLCEVLQSMNPMKIRR
jgi:hypothetical protein